MGRSVGTSKEYRRIVALPRRTWSEEQASECVELLTERLKTPTGGMRLRPIQAIALAEAAAARGGFFPIRVGAGKTLLGLLLPRMFPEARRPLLLIPAALRDKTFKEAKEYRRDWVLPGMIKVESYQRLSTKGCATFLEEYAPDLIIADEVHYLRNRSAACTKRVMRYMRAHPETVFVGMSGTVTKRSIKDFAHLSWIALRDGSPAPDPNDFHITDEWSRALDVNVRGDRRIGAGVLADLHPEGNARKGYRDRLVQTPGVVATQEPPLPIDVTITGHMLESPPDMAEMWAKLRHEWQTPDGWDCADPVEIWRHARELGVGCYYVWDPRPPAEWMAARSAYSAVSREILTTNQRRLDTELQVREAIEAGHYPWAESALRTWQEIAPTFEPNTEHVWVSDHALEWILSWAKEAPGIVWVDHIAVGRALEARGLPYYANMGLSADGRALEDHAPSEGSLCASIAANATGRNLQTWSRNLIVGLPANGAKWEQLLGRCVRPGQKSSCVAYDVALGCGEDVKGFAKAMADAAYTEEMTGQAQILCHADTEGMPLPAEMKGTDQWRV